MKTCSFITILAFCILATGSSIAQTCSINLTLDSQQAVDEFPANYPNCTRIDGEIIIDGPSITNLDSLAHITYIAYLLIQGTNLTDIALNHLDTIGFGLDIKNNESLVNIQLNNLRHAVNVAVEENVLLTNMTFNNLDIIDGSLLLINNNSLVNLEGFSNLTNVDGANISLNGNLNSLEGLNNLKSAGIALVLAFNPQLMDISALSNLTDVQNISIGLTGLTNLNGLENVDYTGINELDISSNFALSVCGVESICNYLAQGGVATAEYNAEGCNTVEEILQSCGTTWVHTAEADVSVNVFPNPFDEYTRFEVHGEAVNELHLSVYDVMGREVLQQQSIHQQHITMKRNKLTPGVYVFRLTDERKQQLATGKLIAE